jgi:hypothetical protein
MTSDQKLAKQLQKKVKALHIIGDAVTPRRIKEAIAEGFDVGYKI